uniref:G-protein coupled receptors family 1 profile domain-containing protein n=1 Tax=Strongyloides stercoralis TaxID=6248 RepID=A0AAF5DRA5_STRER
MDGSWIPYFQLAYTLLLFPIYLFFTIYLGYKIYYLNIPTLRNEYYPIIFYKGVIDNFTIFVQFFTSRIQAFNVFDSFFLQNVFLANVLFFVTSGAYFIMFQIAFLTSFNRYIAISKPALYSRYFNFKRLHLYFIIISIFGIIVGIVSIIYPYTYEYFKATNTIAPIFTNTKSAIVHSIVAVFLDLPIIIITIILNLVCIYKNRLFFKNHKHLKNIEFKILIYGCLLMIVMVAFEAYYLFKNLPYVFKKYFFLESIALMSLTWIVDAMTFGLFIFSFISS